MKPLLALVVLAVGGYYAYQYFTEVPPAPTPVPTPVPTPAPTPVLNLLPPGEFFTKERFSVKTEFGVDALPPLSLVRRSGEEGDTSMVTDNSNGRQWRVPTQILDNNRDALERLKKMVPESLSSADASEGVRQALIAKLEREIQRQQLVLDELALKRKRAEEDLAMAVKRPGPASGGPPLEVAGIQRSIGELDSAKKIAERKIEDAELQIKKENFNEQPLPVTPPRP